MNYESRSTDQPYWSTVFTAGIASSASFLAELSLVIPKIYYFRYIKKYFLDQSVQQIFHLILKKEAPIASRDSFTHVKVKSSRTLFIFITKMYCLWDQSIPKIWYIEDWTLAPKFMRSALHPGAGQPQVSATSHFVSKCKRNTFWIIWYFHTVNANAFRGGLIDISAKTKKHWARRDVAILSVSCKVVTELFRTAESITLVLKFESLQERWIHFMQNTYESNPIKQVFY